MLRRPAGRRETGRPTRNRGWHARRPAFPCHGRRTRKWKHPAQLRVVTRQVPAAAPVFFFFLLFRPAAAAAAQCKQHCSGVNARHASAGGTNPPYRTHCPCPVEIRGLEGVEGRRERYEPGDGPTRLHFPCRDAIIFTWALTPTCRVSRGGSQGSCQYVRYEYFTWYGIPTRCSRLHVSVFLLH